MDSGNPKGNSNLILPVQKRLAGQLCCQIPCRSADFIVLRFGELFRCLFCCSFEEHRVIHARPYKGCYMTPNNEVVDSFIVLSPVNYCVYAFFGHQRFSFLKEGPKAWHGNSPEIKTECFGGTQ